MDLDEFMDMFIASGMARESTNTKIPHMYYISVNGIKEMYNPLHEAHEDSFVEVLNNNIEEKES